MQYKMKFENDIDLDANISKSHGATLVDLWTGKKYTVAKSYPIFTTHYRPLRILFVKESLDVTNEEIDYIKS